MGLFNLFREEPKKGVYLMFTCLKCNSKIEAKVHTDTLRVLKASIRPPEFCNGCSERNEYNFRYTGLKVF